jgi:hypothetical protein
MLDGLQFIHLPGPSDGYPLVVARMPQANQTLGHRAKPLGRYIRQDLASFLVRVSRFVPTTRVAQCTARVTNCICLIQSDWKNQR